MKNTRVSISNLSKKIKNICKQNHNIWEKKKTCHNFFNSIQNTKKKRPIQEPTIHNTTSMLWLVGSPR